jgi:hypothetical protein
MASLLSSSSSPTEALNQATLLLSARLQSHQEQQSKHQQQQQQQQNFGVPSYRHVGGNSNHPGNIVTNPPLSNWTPSLDLGSNTMTNSSVTSPTITFENLMTNLNLSTQTSTTSSPPATPSNSVLPTTTIASSSSLSSSVSLVSSPQPKPSSTGTSPNLGGLHPHQQQQNSNVLHSPSTPARISTNMFVEGLPGTTTTTTTTQTSTSTQIQKPNNSNNNNNSNNSNNNNMNVNNATALNHNGHQQMNELGIGVGHQGPPRVDPRVYKTEMCRFYLTSGKCRFGDSCTFGESF